jgi:hypothetical protein
LLLRPFEKIRIVIWRIHHGRPLYGEIMYQ